MANWKEDIEFEAQVMVECQKIARLIAQETGCDQTACGNSMFIECMMRIKKRGMN